MDGVSMCRSHPIDNAGFFSFTTFTWMTPMMWALFRNKLDMSSLKLSPLDVAHRSGERSDTLLADSGLGGRGETLHVDRVTCAYISDITIVLDYKLNMMFIYANNSLSEENSRHK